MSTTHLQTHGAGRILATDLDGTLIPLDGNEQNKADLATLSAKLNEHEVDLVFTTGRYLESVLHIAQRMRLPEPDWIICDVGTSIFQRAGAPGTWDFSQVKAFGQHQEEIVSSMPLAQLRDLLKPIHGLRLQEEQKQGRFKLSFYADADRLEELVGHIEEVMEQAEAPFSLIHSVDPFNGDGLIDLLPRGFSKAGALAWWVEHTGLDPARIVFAGDSGNDLAALTAGYRAIVVANAARSVAKNAYAAHRKSGWQNRLYLAERTATSGVLEGCTWFGLFPEQGVEGKAIDRVGATPICHDQTHFRVWAPGRQRVSVELETGDQTTRHRLKRQEGGYFASDVLGASPGTKYRYLLDHQVARPDPASRFQPDGVHGASQVVDPQAFPWSDQDWQGVAKRDLIIYELHVGAFTQDGTFRAAIDRLPELADLGVTAVELMPVAQTPGRWNWGYDGVDLFAVRNTYGHPDDFKSFVDACHAHGLAVLLDVVYNHIGPEGNYLADFGPYFSQKHHTPWGQAFNLDGRHSNPVRRFILDNAIDWLQQYHLDGLRLDAVHFVLDESDPHILAELRRAVTKLEERIARKLHLIAETNVYDGTLLNATETTDAYDAIWCDCLMHSMYSHSVPQLRLTGRDYRGASDIFEVLKHGYVYECPAHQRVERRQSNSSTEASCDPHIASLVTALQTHDSVGNHPSGQRIHHVASKQYQQAAAALTLLFPSIPLIFMGEEHACDAPFPFFVDFEDEQLRSAVDEGRKREHPHHDWRHAPLPSDAESFLNAKCQAMHVADPEMLAWYRALIAIRKHAISNGWLTPANLMVLHEPDSDVFTLEYRHNNVIVLRLDARLTPPSRANAPPAKVPLVGNVVLASSALEMERDCVFLAPNNVVLCERR